MEEFDLRELDLKDIESGLKELEEEAVKKEKQEKKDETDIEIEKEGEDKKKEKTKKEVKPHEPMVSELNIEKEEEKEFDFEEDEFKEDDAPSPKTVWLIAGDKGEGKTVSAFSFPGVIACLSFDKKSAIIKHSFYKGDSRIHVWSPVKYYVFKSKEEITKAAAKVYEYTLKLLDYIEKNIKPDWIVIDNTEQLVRICEFTARYYNRVPPFAGTGQVGWRLWDERNHYIRAIFNRCFEVAKKGVIYTTYLQQSDVVIEGGEVLRRKETPKWVDAIKFETDIVVKVWKDQNTRTFYAEILSSKNDELAPTGTTLDVTGKGLWPALQELRKRGGK